jgi:hypothetical protein
MSAFIGAPHFSGGGIVGDGVAHKGEGVLTPAQMKAIGGSAEGTVHQWHISGGTVVVQGNADEKTLPMIQAATAQNNASLTKRITRTLGTIQSKSAQLYQRV